MTPRRGRKRKFYFFFRQTKNVRKHAEAGERIKKENTTLERQRKTTRKGIISSTQRKRRILKRKAGRKKRNAKNG